MDWLAVLLVPALVHGTVVALLLLAWRPRRTANVLLAALLLLLAIELLPQVLGFFGFFDDRPSLWYAPLAVGWGIPAAAWLYVLSLLGGRWQRARLAHFAPLAVLLSYRLWLFALPLPRRLEWARSWHEPVLAPLEDGVTHVLALVYLWASLALYRRHQRLMPRTRSDADRYALRWLRFFLSGSLALFVASAANEAASLAFGRPGASGFAYTGFLALSLYALSIAGYRMGEVEVPPAEAPPRELEPRTPRPHLERLLARALSEVGDVNFATFVNRRRVEWAAARLADPAERRTVLEIGLAAGFSAKATLNRVFRERTGRTPSRAPPDVRQGGRSRGKRPKKRLVSRQSGFRDDARSGRADLGGVPGRARRRLAGGDEGCESESNGCFWAGPRGTRGVSTRASPCSGSGRGSRCARSSRSSCPGPGSGARRSGS
jgi:AraC-like DNA-binding protein